MPENIGSRGAVSVKASGSVALANQVFKISWQWLASGFSGSIIQVFKMGLVVGNLAWRNVERGKFRLRRPFYEGASPLDPHVHVFGVARARARQRWCDFLAQLDFCPLENGFLGV